jgi:hypothetical protein
MHRYLQMQALGRVKTQLVQNKACCSALIQIKKACCQLLQAIGSEITKGRFVHPLLRMCGMTRAQINWNPLID